MSSRSGAAAGRHTRTLRTELADWTSQGIISPDQADRISLHYRADLHTRFSIGRILLTIGGAFVGIGLIWLVAANLDQLSPVTRFGAVTPLFVVRVRMTFAFLRKSFICSTVSCGAGAVAAVWA